MKKIKVLVISCLIILSLSGCGATNTDRERKVYFNDFVMIEISDGLWYDSSTRIVYFWNGEHSDSVYASTQPSPYYAQNGFPYRYDPTTNTLQEIEG